MRKGIVVFLATAVVSISALSTSTTVHARRSMETEYSFIASNGMSGSVLYPCLGGAYYTWDDGVARTRWESERLLDQHAVRLTDITGVKLRCSDSPARYHCAAEFGPGNQPTTWADAIDDCSPWYFDS